MVILKDKASYMYYKLIECIISAILGRLDQPGYTKYQQLEVLLIIANQAIRLEMKIMFASPMEMALKTMISST